jgi:cytochrome P450
VTNKTPISAPPTPQFPPKRTCPFAPPALYSELRELRPVSKIMLPSGMPAWLVARHADIRAVLGSPLVSSNPRRPGFPQLHPHDAEDANREPVLIEMDPPQHDIQRKMLAKEFSVARVDAMRSGIEKIVNEQIDALLRRGPPADLLATFALPIPSRVIAELLGIPYADHDLFESRTRAAVSSSTSNEEATAAFEEISGYLDRLVTAKEQHPTDDLLGRLIMASPGQGALTHEELVRMAVLLLMAGFETTANSIALGVVALLEHPAQLALLRSDPSLASGAVEELLRYNSLADTDALRVAVSDLEVGGQLVRAGEGIIPLFAAGNRDPRVFERPDDLDIRRSGRNHLGFGYGVHQCVGLNLARAQIEIAYRTLFARLPTLRLAAPLAELPFKYEDEVWGLEALPVAW